MDKCSKKHRSATALRLSLLREYSLFIRNAGWEDRWTLPHTGLFEGAFEQMPVKVNKWHAYLPKLKHRSYTYKLRQGFQSTKKIAQQKSCYSPELSLIRNILFNFTVEDPLFMLECLFPKVQGLCSAIRSGKVVKFIKQYDETVCKLVYVTLNIYFNWFRANCDQYVITDSVPVPDLSTSALAKAEGDLRCSYCNKSQTFRSSLKKGNPRNNEPETSLDSMSFVSSCCSAQLMFVPLTVSDSTYVIYTPMNQMYTNCAKCGTVSFSEFILDPESISLCSKCAKC